MALIISARRRKSFKKLIDFSDDQTEALFEGLENARPAATIRGLASRIALEKDLPEEAIFEILAGIVGLYWLKEDKSKTVNELVDDVCTTLSSGENSESQLAEEDQEKLGKRLGRFLSFDKSLGVTSKALDLATESPYIFCHARTVVDVRPIFHSGPDEQPHFSVLTNTLVVRYHEGHDTKEFFLALDEEDIDELVAVLERAKMKRETIKAKMGLSILED